MNWHASLSFRVATLLLLALLWLNPINAEEPTELRAAMQQLGSGVAELLPQVYAQSAGRSEFVRALTSLEQLLAEAEDHLAHKPVTSQITYRVLRRHISEALMYAESARLGTVQSMFRQSIALCAGCHRQDQIVAGTSPLFDAGRLGDFVSGELRFLTRDYDNAAERYLAFWRYELSNEERRQLVLHRLLIISLEVKNNPSAAIKFLEQAQYDGYRFSGESQRIETWLRTLELVTDRDQSTLPPTDSMAALDEYMNHQWPEIAEDLDADAKLIYWLLIRHELNRYLQASVKENLPVILYWLARSDRETNYRLYDFVSRQYLEHCVRDFSRHPYAKRCYEEYDLLMHTFFMTSSGRKIPARIRAEMDELKLLLD